MSTARNPMSKDASRPKGLVSARRVLQAFNTWAYKREQPTEPQVLLRSIASAIAKNDPISFVLYWGKGPRDSIAEPELACLDYLGQMRQRIENVYAPGAQFTLILTDTHASLNGHHKAAISNYFHAVRRVADPRFFSCCHLSDLVEIVQQVAPEDDAKQPDAEILRKLEHCASKWYRGEESFSDGASNYYSMNMVERRAVEVVFPTSIFITFNGSEYRELFPASLPVFYMYSIKKGVSEKPWFARGGMSIPGTPCSPLSPSALGIGLCHAHERASLP
jgi:hypothetical protein